ncbi:MAG: hypothetical protein ACXW5U_01760 [Thermoanaerobaculia bacterium]
MRTILASVLLFAAGCASTATDRPADIAQPEIRVARAGPVFFGSSSTTSVSIDVHVTNRAAVPILLREVEISSQGASHYTIERIRKLFHETIPAGETRTVNLVATGVALQRGVTEGEPLPVRITLRLEANGKSFRETTLDRLP